MTLSYNNGGFANYSLHPVSSLVGSVGNIIAAAGYTHFIVVNGETVLFSFYGC